jgi:hypothetical protein
MTDSERKDKPPKPTTIHIDKDRFEIQGPTATGAELRALPNPPVGSDRDLFEEVPGGSDRRVDDGTVVQLRNGQHFFTAPATINPG